MLKENQMKGFHFSLFFVNTCLYSSSTRLSFNRGLQLASCSGITPSRLKVLLHLLHVYPSNFHSFVFMSYLWLKCMSRSSGYLLLISCKSFSVIFFITNSLVDEYLERLKLPFYKYLLHVSVKSKRGPAI